MANNFNYGVERGIAVISRYGDESKELNLISYGNRPPKYDLRTWKEQPDGGRIMLKGITLSPRTLLQNLRPSYCGIVG